MSDQITSLVRGRFVLEGFLDSGEPIVHTNAAIAVGDGRVQAIGDAEAQIRRHPHATVLGDAGALVIPGLVNSHHHVGLTPLQLGSPDLPLELWFASRLGLRDVDLYLDTLYSAFEMIASGVTTVQHLHSRVPGGVEQLSSAAGDVARAYRDIGMRASYSMAMRDQNRLVYASDHDFVQQLPESLRDGMRAYFERFTLPLSDQVDAFTSLLSTLGDDPRIRVQLAPANLHWLSDAALTAVADLAERYEVPLHMHLLETAYQKEYARRRTEGSALSHIHEFGLTGPKMTLGHGVWMTEDDIALCAETGTHLCHNCSSNLRLRSGIAPLNRFLELGIPVAIGIDEAGINDDRDMLQEMRMVLRLHRTPGMDGAPPDAAAVLRMASEHGAATTPFAGTIGKLTPGYWADLAVLDWRAVTRPYQDANISVVDTLVQRAKPDAMRLVMVGGEPVYRDGSFVNVDREAVLSEIEARLAEPLTDAERRRAALSRAIFPHVRSFYDDYLPHRPQDPFYRANDRR